MHVVRGYKSETTAENQGSHRGVSCMLYLSMLNGKISEDVSINRWMDCGWMDGWMDEWMDGQRED